MRATSSRRAITALLSFLTAGFPGGVHGAPSVDFDREVELLADEGRFSEAGDRLKQALAELPVNLENRDRRNFLATQAVNAYALAFERTPHMCELATAGLEVADEYLSALLAEYGASVRKSDEYVGLNALREELSDARRDQGCSGDTNPSARTADEVPSWKDEPKPEHEKNADPGKRQKTAGLVLLGVGGAAVISGAGVGIAFGVKALGLKKDIAGLRQGFAEAMCDPEDPSPGICSDLDGQISAVVSDGKKAHVLSGVGWGVTSLGVALVVTGGVLFAKGKRKTNAHIRVLPTLGGLTLAGVF
ncbi:MAG: hypothetical protein H6716_28080 [Polyangiaceae bacterium]|nr:hypothetical protein [Polyangiaceae bacterium]